MRRLGRLPPAGMVPASARCDPAHALHVRAPLASDTRAAWLVLRATQLRAPYRLVTRDHGESFDPACAAELEVEWWRVHRHTSATARVQTNGRLSKRWRPCTPMSTTDRTETAAFTMSDRLRALAQS